MLSEMNKKTNIEDVELATANNTYYAIKHVPARKIPSDASAPPHLSQELPNLSPGNSNYDIFKAIRADDDASLTDISLKHSADNSAFRVIEHNKIFPSAKEETKSPRHFSITPGAKCRRIDKVVELQINYGQSPIADQLRKSIDSIETDSKSDYMENLSPLLKLLADTPTPSTPRLKVQTTTSFFSGDDKWSSKWDNTSSNNIQQRIHSSSSSFSPDVFGIVSQIVGKQSPMIDSYHGVPQDLERIDYSIDDINRNALQKSFNYQNDYKKLPETDFLQYQSTNSDYHVMPNNPVPGNRIPFTSFNPDDFHSDNLFANRKTYHHNNNYNQSYYNYERDDYLEVTNTQSHSFNSNQHMNAAYSNSNQQLFHNELQNVQRVPMFPQSNQMENYIYSSATESYNNNLLNNQSWQQPVQHPSSESLPMRKYFDQEFEPKTVRQQSRKYNNTDNAFAESHPKAKQPSKPLQSSDNKWSSLPSDTGKTAANILAPKIAVPQSSFESDASTVTNSSISVASRIAELHLSRANSSNAGSKLDTIVKPDKETNSHLRSSRDSKVSYSATVASSSNNKQETLESPRSKAAFKEFFRKFRIKEKEDSVESCRKFCLETLSTVPDGVEWKIYLELADYEKRNNNVEDARKCYSEVCILQPHVSTGWFEWSKMEEENGKLRKALKILICGLKTCKVNEALLTRVIKLNERLHKYAEVRGMLSELRHESIEKAWKSILEGSLFEARAGNIPVSRKVLKFLMKNVPWYGPIYHEAFRLEEKESNDNAALKIIYIGLQELPRYGPLWFGLIRVLERFDARMEYSSWLIGKTPQLVNLRREVAVATKLISKELNWKVYFEWALIEERVAEIAATGRYHKNPGISMATYKDGLIKEARQCLMKSLLVCPNNLRWKVYLVACRMELSVDAVDRSRQLLEYALREVPTKSKSIVYLECARLEEYLDNVEFAREILKKARDEVSLDWKLSLESILLEIRCGELLTALRLSKIAVITFPGTGRLWAIYVQLCHRLEHLKFLNDPKSLISTPDEKNRKNLKLNNDQKWSNTIQSIPSKDQIIRFAIAEVPKSGEVWCERGRCHLNPSNLYTFNLTLAQRSLSFAIQFTPQYGDSFVEYIRFEMLCQVLLPKLLLILNIPMDEFIKKHLNEDSESDVSEFINSPRLLNELILKQKERNLNISSEKRMEILNQIINLTYEFDSSSDIFDNYHKIIIKKLILRCANADPNYGVAWSFCRFGPNDIPRTVLTNTIEILSHELSLVQKLYFRAILHFIHDITLLIPSAIHDKTLASPLGSPKKSQKKSNILNKSMESMMVHSNSMDKLMNLSSKSSGRDDIQLEYFRSPNEFQSSTTNNYQPSSTTLTHSDVETNSLPNFYRFFDIKFYSIIEINAGELFHCTDFVTGIIALNRSIFNKYLTPIVKRKNIFNTDQIIS